MSRFSPDRYRLQVTDRTFILSRRKPRDREWQRAALGEHPSIVDFPTFMAALTQFSHLRLPRGARWSALIDDELARFFVVTPPEQVASLRELQHVCALQCESLFGDPAGDWICMGDWRASGPFLVCALPKSLLQTLASVASQQRARLDSVTPCFVQTWNEWAPRMPQRQAWFAHITERHAVLVAASGGTPIAVSQLASPGCQDADALRTLIRRASLQWGIATPSILYAAGDSMRRWHGHRVDGCRIQHLVPTLAHEASPTHAVLEAPCLPAEEPQT
ncbi:hypothetical protein [Cupriavidus sp. SIMBA_020]|uniref:hypothetical protein n=1 Tax=Cupriavidus sp. SIMBA_020 TaxID=3085766 RepID=UPI00397A6E97